MLVPLQENSQISIQEIQNATPQLITIRRYLLTA